MPMKEVLSSNFFQPCCGFFLQGCVKTLAILDVGVECGMIVLHGSGIYAGYKYWEDEPDAIKRYARPFHWAFHFLYNFLSLLMSYYLHKYASQRNEKGLLRWLTLSWAFFIPALIVFFSQSFYIGWKEQEYMCGAGCGVFIPYKLYGLWVVARFRKEVIYYGGFNSALTQLPDADVNDFFEGHRKEAGFHNRYKFEEKPYQKSFEIPLSRIQVDNNHLLGKGEFGVVYKGLLIPTEMESQSYVVAVKTISDTATLCHFKALLSELKILSYLGQHDNVVNLVGACTSDIKNRKLYILVEFCPLGSLLNYLKSTRGMFVDMYNPTVNLSGYLPPSTLSAPSTLNLLQWSMQTASGMEYISSKKVIHGDLAARNLLLTLDMQIKIADFGLSRQLYQCYNYRKNSDEPLPWRWLALESLTDLHFSTESDVWSYGITIWELFTCGEVPYGGHNYSTEFLREIQNNCLRPERPAHASVEIYQVLMSCWNLNPKTRPSFAQLRGFFEHLYLKSVNQQDSNPNKMMTHSEDALDYVNIISS